MFIDSLISLFLRILDYLPGFDLSTSLQIYDTFLEYVDMAAYFIPMGTVMTILKIVIAEEMFKIVLSLIKLILSFIPFMGGS